MLDQRNNYVIGSVPEHNRLISSSSSTSFSLPLPQTTCIYLISVSNIGAGCSSDHVLWDMTLRYRERRVSKVVWTS